MAGLLCTHIVNLLEWRSRKPEFSVVFDGYANDNQIVFSIWPLFMYGAVSTPPPGRNGAVRRFNTTVFLIGVQTAAPFQHQGKFKVFLFLLNKI